METASSSLHFYFIVPELFYCRNYFSAGIILVSELVF